MNDFNMEVSTTLLCLTRERFPELIHNYEVGQFGECEYHLFEVRRLAAMLMRGDI